MLKAFHQATGSERVLGKGAGIAFITQVSAVGLGYVAHVFLARWMGVTEYGSYVYALGWAVPLAALGGLGIHLVALRFVPTYASAGAYGLLRGSYRIGSNIAFNAGLLVTLISLAVLALAGSRISSSLWWSLVVGVSLVPLLSLTHFNASFLKALKRVGLAGFSDVARPPLLILGAAGLLAFSGAVTARALLLVLGGALLLTALVQYLLVRSAMPEPARRARTTSEFPVWKKAVGGMLLIEVFQAVMVKADILLLGAMMDVDAVAVFGVSTRVAGLVGFVVAAISTMAGPMFTELHGLQKHHELTLLVRTAGKWMFWPSLAVAAAIATFSPYVLGLFGQDFLEGSTALWILLGAQLVHAAAGPVFVLVTFTGFHEQSARIYGYMLLMNIVLNVIGIRLLGIEGAALAALVTAVVWSVMLHRSVTSNLGLSASPLIHLLTGSRAKRPEDF